jgi:hypothetical protein
VQRRSELHRYIMFHPETKVYVTCQPKEVL